MYHYTECGLSNIWLINGYKIYKTPYGNGVAIDDADGLDTVIATRLTVLPRLTGAQFRFLRKRLDMSQVGLAALLGTDSQTIARYEKGRPTKMADRFLRLIYREKTLGNAMITETIARLNDLDQPAQQKLTFQETESGWTLAAA